MAYKIEAGVTSDKGVCREQNEDNFLCQGVYLKAAPDRKSLRRKGKPPAVYAVCDGMGGFSHGSKAAYLVAEELSRYDRQLSGKSQEYLSKELDLMIKAANLRVCEAAKPKSRMGSTLAFAYLNWDKIYLANVGDSRIYQVKDHEIKQLSLDHNQAQYMKSQGMACSPGMQHMLTQYIGIPPEKMIIEPHYDTLEYEEMMLLLCSDGLTDALSDINIADIIIEYKKKNPKKITKHLIKQAILQGSEDNLTALLIKISKK